MKLEIDRRRRKWIYVSSPVELCYGHCPKCGAADRLIWSTYYPFVWCLNCEDDVIPYHYGVVDGPVAVEVCRLLGISFDAVDLLTHTIIPFDSPIWPTIDDNETTPTKGTP